MKKVKLLIFDTPPLQNHCFGVSMEVKMEPKWSLKSIFIAIENDDRKAMLFKEGFFHDAAYEQVYHTTVD